MVVEDESLVRMATSGSLRDEGLDVIEAADTDEAIRLLSVVSVDAVFSDVTMPGTMDGIGLAKWIQDHLPAVTALLTSGAAGAV
jgi:CheY-like chemotaxis protein